jgi:orotate phosphoribosyltransferase
LKEKDRLLELLLERSFRFSEEPIFRLASGRLSNYYVDCKPTTMSPDGLALIGPLVLSVVQEWGVSAVGGLTLGADPIAYATAYASGGSNMPVKAFVVRKEAKDHGMGKRIEGPVEPGERVAIVEDVITTGGSTLKAIEATKEFGLDIAGVIALVDRQEGGKERIESLGLHVVALVSREELLAKAKER